MILTQDVAPKEDDGGGAVDGMEEVVEVLTDDGGGWGVSLLVCIIFAIGTCALWCYRDQMRTACGGKYNEFQGRVQLGVANATQSSRPKQTRTSPEVETNVLLGPGGPADAHSDAEYDSEEEVLELEMLEKMIRGS